MKNFFRRIWFDYFYRFGSPPWDTGVSPPELITYLEAHPAGRAIDLGCGTGTNVATISKYGWQVTGIDFSPKAIHTARRKLFSTGTHIELFVADVTQLRTNLGLFDLVLDIGCFHSLDAGQRLQYYQTLKNLLSPDADYLMYAFWSSPDESSGPGLVPTDQQALQSFLRLVSRTDGTERGRRPSSWFHFSRLAF